jgi:hypothetical protein
MPLGNFIVFFKTIYYDICSVLHVLCIPLILFAIISISKDLWNVKKLKTENAYIDIS